MAYPLAEQKQLQRGADSHSAIDDLIATNDLKQFADSNKNRLYEFFFGPQDMELDRGFAPDLAFAPFMSKKNLANLLKDFTGKAKSMIKTPNKMQALKDVAIETGTKLSEKITPKIAEPLSKSDIARRQIINLEAGLDMGEGYYKNRAKQTIFGRLLEGRSRKKLYNKLATKTEFEKFKNTYPNLASGRSPEVGLQQTISGGFNPMDFKDYKKWVKDIVLDKKQSGSLENIIGESFKSGKVEALGEFDPLSKKIKMASEVNPSQWGSTLRHEIKHELDDLFTEGFKSGDYKRLMSRFKEGIRPEIKEIMKNPDDLRMGWINYILKPTETLTRSTQLKTKGIGQTILEGMGTSSKPRAELEGIYTKEFIKELMNKYWAAAPIGALGTEMKFRDSKIK